MIADPNKFRGDRDSVWQFWDHGVTQSLLGEFLTCRKTCELNYVQGWKPKHEKTALTDGRIGHYVLHWMRYRRDPLPGPDTVMWLVNQYQIDWEAELADAGEQATEQEQEKMRQSLEVMRVLLDRYVKRWQGDWTGEYPEGYGATWPAWWVDSELSFAVPYTFPDGAQTVIRGVWDWLFFDKKGRLYISDVKFKARIDEDLIQDTLEFDRQVMLYLWAVMHTFDEKIGGVLYDVIRRPQLRKRQDDSIGSFVDRIRDDLDDPKRTDHYFKRYDLGITKKEIDRWQKRWLDPVMQDVRAWWEGTAPHYMNDDALQRKYGRSDYYLPLVKNVYDHHYQRSTPFSEIEGAN